MSRPHAPIIGGAGDVARTLDGVACTGGPIDSPAPACITGLTKLLPMLLPVLPMGTFGDIGQIAELTRAPCPLTSMLAGISDDETAIGWGPFTAGRPALTLPCLGDPAAGDPAGVAKDCGVL
mmetsp:Transcript_6386/g.16261  ORF Transcript_6386/g.16261 Transcript_6386/m.16261 type:complete len:122 (-) Transcript_6386:224-589(-)